MKYKLGSLVRIRNIKSTEEATKLAHYGYHPNMIKFSGKVFRIINTYESPGYPRDFIVHILQEQDMMNEEGFRDVGDWSWVEEWLEPTGRVKIRVGDLV